MEASAAIGPGLLARDGAAPIAPVANAGRCGHEPISGAVCCEACRRELLVGENASLRQGRFAHGWYCESCDARALTRLNGRRVRTARVRSLGGALNVRRVPAR